MATVFARHAEALPAQSRLLRRESVRVVGAFAALVAATLLLTAGLLWRENARPRPQPHRAHVVQTVSNR